MYDVGTIYFGNWYVRRDFGVINVFCCAITQCTDEQRKIRSQLEAFLDDPDVYLDRQLDASCKEVYHDVDLRYTQIDNLEAEAAPERDVSAQGNGGSRGLLKNSIDPSDESELPAAQLSKTELSQLKARFDKEKLAADDASDKRKRELEVLLAITRYEYQAVLSTYSLVLEFENVLLYLKDDSS